MCIAQAVYFVHDDRFRGFLFPSDWLTFSERASERRKLVNAIPDTRDREIEWEERWVENSVRQLIELGLKSEKPVARDHWQRIHEEILALQSVDMSEKRFAKARTQLFAVAHDAAKRQIAKHLQQGEFDLAYGVARVHAVTWDATAALSDKQLELHSTRLVCQYLAHIYSNLTPPPDPEEIAPPPRAKPEKQPEP